jgi:hypothetical protein
MQWIWHMLTGGLGPKGFVALILVASHAAAGGIGYVLCQPSSRAVPPPAPDVGRQVVEAELPDQEIQWPEMPDQLIVYKTPAETVEVRVPVPEQLAADVDLQASYDSLPSARRRLQTLDQLWITSRSPVEVTPEVVTLSAFDPATTNWRQVRYAVPPPTWKYFVAIEGAAGLRPAIDGRFAPRHIQAEIGVGYKELFLSGSAGVDRQLGEQFLVHVRWIPWGRR